MMARLVFLSHVLGAILAVGPSMTYGVWVARGRRAGPSEEAFAFRGIMWLDAHLVTPAFAWQLISGLLLVFVFRRADIHEPWLAASLVIYLLVAGVAVAVVAPRARRAVAALEQHGSQAGDYVGYRKMMRPLTPLIAAGTLTIVVLMVLRPG